MLTEYRGLTVAQLKRLRRSLGTGTTYAVAKNTLAKRALKGTSFETLSAHFEGTTAIAYTGSDPVALAAHWPLPATRRAISSTSSKIHTRRTP